MKKPTVRELDIINDARRSIVASQNLKKGTIITDDMIEFKRPGYGIQPDMSYILIGRSIKRDLKKDEVIELIKKHGGQ